MMRPGATTSTTELLLEGEGDEGVQSSSFVVFATAFHVTLLCITYNNRKRDRPVLSQVS